MISVILSTATRYLAPLMLLFSFYTLLRGHNDPGGGFIGGLVAAAALALYAIAYDADRARHLLAIDPIRLIASGLLIAVLSGIPAWIAGDPFMTGQWDSSVEFPVLGKVGTPFVFDVGVYLVVIGITLIIILSLMEE